MCENNEINCPQEMMDLICENGTEHLENYRKNIVTKISYLIGVDEKTLENGSFVLEEIDKLRANEDATIIRNLCILRTQFFRNYLGIRKARQNFERIDKLDGFLSLDSIEYLSSKGIDIADVTDRPAPAINIAYINQYIQDNIDKIKDIIPDWIKFKYVKALFLMPGAYAGKNGDFLKKNYSRVVSNVKQKSQSYVAHRKFFPYGMYLTWPCDLEHNNDGNILYNDLKFLKLLYEYNNDQFSAQNYVIDAKIESKKDIYKFLNEARTIGVYVDCENVDPYAFAATLKNLDQSYLAKIKFINLYDDANASTAWDYISHIIDIPVEHNEVERVLENKSLVDITMACDIKDEFYNNDVDSAMLVSSDSDFWALIKGSDKIDFFVLNEYTKTSPAIIKALDEHCVPHCYMGDFAQDIVQKFKTQVLCWGLEDRLSEFNETGAFSTLDVKKIIDELFEEAYIKAEKSQLEKEKDTFFRKYLKNGFVLKPTSENGCMKFQIELRGNYK